MKSKFFLIILPALLLILTTACNNSSAKAPEPEKESALEILQEEIRDSDSVLEAAFIGYVGDKKTDDEVLSFLGSSAYADKYPFLCREESCSFVSCEGNELYALVPAGDTCSIRICGTALTDACEYADDPDNVIFTGAPGETILLRCNISDIYSNTAIYVTGGSGDHIFHLRVSLNDGTVATEKGYYDFTLTAVSKQMILKLPQSFSAKQARQSSALSRA